MSAVEAARTDSPDDLTLVAHVRAGDDRAFEALYGRYRSRITGYVQGMVGDWARAEDVTQEVFISALRRMRATDRPIAFRPWIFEIAKNACIDQFRRSKRTDEVPWETDDGEGIHFGGGGQTGATPRTPESAAESSEQLTHLRGAFGALSESHHEILVLRELEGLSYREIGERMGLSRPGVESTLFRARRRLTEEYDDLSTGRSCERMGTVLVAAEHGSLGVREHRRLARHVAWCRPCRRQARIAGVEGLAPVGAAAKIAAFLPLPVVDLLRRLRGGGGGGVGGAAASAAQNMDAMGAGWSKAALAVAALATAGAGAGVVHEVSSAPDGTARAPAHHAAPAPASAPSAKSVAGRSRARTAERRTVPGGDASGRVRAKRGQTKGGALRGGAGSSSRSTAQGPGRPGGSGGPQRGGSGGGGGPSGPVGGKAAAAPSTPSGTKPKALPTPNLPSVPHPTVRVPPVQLPPVALPGLPPVALPGVPPVALPGLPPVAVPPITIPPVHLPDPGGVLGGAGGVVKGVVGGALHLGG